MRVIVNDITNFCFRPCKAVYVSFCKAENEISNVVNYILTSAKIFRFLPVTCRVWIPLDIFKKTMQNKPIEALQEAWLTSLSGDAPQRLAQRIKQYVKYAPMGRNTYRQNYTDGR